MTRPFDPRASARISAAVGLAGILACLVGAFLDPVQFFRSYLIGFLFWTGVALGCLAILMLYHLVGGKWGYLARRILEAGTRTFPLLALLFVPLVFGARFLFPWARPEVVAGDAILLAKARYLNVPFFAVRGAVLFAVWILLASFLNRWSAEQDATDDFALGRKLQALSAGGLVLYAGTTFFASVDWMMSLSPHWYSSIFGMSFMVGHGLSAMAFVLLAVWFLSATEPFASVARPEVFRDLGSLLFMFLMLWAYMTFSQLIIIWGGNLPEEISFYLPRLQTSWKFVSLFILLVYFGAPFLLLLSRKVKRDLRFLAAIAAAVLVMRTVDLVWLVEPIFHPRGIFVHALDFAAPIGIGGVWTAVFLAQLGRRPLLAVHDPRMEGAVDAHETAGRHA
jgi:hypothetical protein